MSDDELAGLVRDLRAASEERCDGPYATSDPDLDHPILLREAADEIERLQAKAAKADELQALIDDLVRTWADHVRTGSFGHVRPFRALFAVATKHDHLTA